MKSIGPLLFSSITGIVCEKLVAAVAAVVGNHLFANIYGPQLFGELQFALALSFAIGSAALVFSAQAVAPILSKHPRLRHLVYYRIFRLRLVSTLGVMLIFALGAWLVMDQASAEFTLVVGLVLIVEPFALGILMAYAERQPWVVTRAKTLASAARVLWIFTAAHFSAGAIIAALAWPLEGCIAVAGPFRRYSKLALHAPKSFLGDDVVKRALVVHGLKLWPAVAASTLIIRLDRILLAMLMSKTDLGIYSAAASLIEQLNSIGMALAFALAPSMVFVARNEVQLRAKALKLGLYLGLLGTVAFVGSVAIGHAAFMMIYGPRFEAGAPVMIFMTACSIATFADAGLATWLIAARRYRLILIKQGLTLAAIAASPFVVPQTAIMYAPAAAIALSLMVFWCVIYGQTAYRTSKRPTSSASTSLPEPNGRDVQQRRS